MISYINIKNIALIQELTLELTDGLNILSGETGAGKSIIIDSINFVLGDRADRSLIRHGENSARVELVFDKIINFATIRNVLEENGIDYDEGTITVTRLMTPDRSECRINGRIVTLVTLRNIVGLLVEINSQNEHQSLLKVANHIRLLDAFSSVLPSLKEHYHTLLDEYQAINRELEGFLSAEDRARQIDMLSFQVNEINDANLKVGEEEDLINTRNKFYNAQKIVSALNNAINLINGDNGLGATTSLKQALSELRTIIKYDTEIETLSDRLDSAIIEIEDIGDTLENSYGAEELEGINIDTIERKIENIRLLKKKYGKTVDEINLFRDKADTELNRLLNSEQIIVELNTKKSVLETKLIELVRSMHDERVKVSSKFCKDILKNLLALGMKGTQFEVDIKLSDDIVRNMGINGADTVEFLLSPNLGEPLKPLAKIASGGEMSRFMLALKNIIAEVDDIDTLIFDEIDTGISGVIAKVVATKLYGIAVSRQVIAITHLPQLASMADANYLIEKRVVNNKTLTYVTKLTEEGVYNEIMRLTGAVENSSIGLQNAQELKAWANSYKQSI